MPSSHRAVVALAASLAAACLEPAATTCLKRALPGGLVCDERNVGCVTQDQLDQCEGKEDGTRGVRDATTGLCTGGACLAACGDTAMQSGEECDDGNASDGDGCTAACEVETPTWRQVRDPWPERLGHTVAYDPARGVIILHGGVAADDNGALGATNDTWERSADGRWQEIEVPERPPARRLAMMAFD